MSDPPAKRAKPDPYAKWQSARDEKTGAVYYYHVDSKKTSWTWPPPLDDGDKADTPSSDVPEFEASATYAGRRPGRVFKRGDRGQGYYRDRAPNETAALPGNLSFYPSKTFAGHKPGMVFRRGDRGQGYYRDRAPNETAALPGNLSFYPSKTFAGHKPGMVFRRGDRGQGYYRDNPFGGVPVGQKCERYNPHA